MIITLLTDFGLQDLYVGVMKGVIKKINPNIDLIDLTHNIPRQNLFSTSFTLQNSVDFFPSDTIYLTVVDPGVGSDRKAIAVAYKQGYFVCPDNGILTGILSKYKLEKVYELTNSHYWLNENASNTFHGRDIFAPVAAYLSVGVPLEELGNQVDVDSLVRLNLPEMVIKENTIIGAIEYIDIYGNLVTNIPAGVLQNKSWWVVENDLKINSGLTYSNVKESDLVALIGSHGYLEIAVNGDSAKMILDKNYGDLVTVKFNYE